MPSAFIYPRTASLYRPRSNGTDPSTGAVLVGLQPYSGVVSGTSATPPQGENLIQANFACSIQTTGSGRATTQGLLPADAPGPIRWKIFVPKNVMPRGTARDRDVVVDDEGYRYQVSSNYWNSLGYRLDCIRLES